MVLPLQHVLLGPRTVKQTSARPRGAASPTRAPFDTDPRLSTSPLVPSSAGSSGYCLARSIPKVRLHHKGCHREIVRRRGYVLASELERLYCCVLLRDEGHRS